ncbi:hypothetical protein [Rhizobium sp. M1]|uniref:hypothetical protein n=1 Tax=Rhizobium sp. M1 TaxID=2035453 RepID=UPI000BE7D764|nr:hypothetical protein [Rhizobium sp. M1]PDT10022.1 hypothetical protein CO655_15635 [Rhizobium sp. M1]
MPLELDHVERLVETIGRRLSFPVDPFPGEGLSDLLFRAACENGYATVKLLAELLGMPPTNRSLSPAAIANNIGMFDPQKVCEILGCARIDPLNIFIDRQSEKSSTHFLFFEREVRTGRFFSVARRVSPLALRRSLHQKAAWSVRGLSFDPDTREELLWRCPKCGNALCRVRSRAVEVCGHCYNRGHVVDLRGYPQDIVKVEDEEALSFVISLINPEVKAPAITDLPVPFELAKFGPGALFDLAVGLARQLSKYDPLADQSRDAGVPARYLALAGRALLEWPEKLTELSNVAFRLRLERTLHNPQHIHESSALHKEKVFGLLRYSISQGCHRGETELWKVVAAAANLSKDQRGADCLIANGFPESGMTSAGALPAPLSPVFRQDKRTVARRIIEGQKYLPQGPAGGAPSFHANYYVASGARAMRRISQEIDIPLPFLMGLVEVNLLEAVDPHVERLALRKGCEPPTTSFRDRLIAGGDGISVPEGAAPLQSVLVLINGHVNPWPDLAKALLDKKIPYWYGGAGVRFLDRLWVKDIEALWELLSSAVTRSELYDVPVCFHELASYLGVAISSITQLKAKGFLASGTLGSAWELRSKFIMVNEVRRRLSIHGEEASNSSIAAELARASMRSEYVRGASLYKREGVEAYYGFRLAPLITQGRQAEKATGAGW